MDNSKIEDLLNSASCSDELKSLIIRYSDKSKKTNIEIENILNFASSLSSLRKDRLFSSWDKLNQDFNEFLDPSKTDTLKVIKNMNAINQSCDFILKTSKYRHIHFDSFQLQEFVNIQKTVNRLLIYPEAAMLRTKNRKKGDLKVLELLIHGTYMSMFEIHTDSWAKEISTSKLRLLKGMLETVNINVTSENLRRIIKSMNKKYAPVTYSKKGRPKLKA